MFEPQLDCEVVITTSGARAMLDRTTGEVMHPVVGPLVEPSSLYIRPARIAERLLEPGDGPLVVLDVGLGAGAIPIAALRARTQAGLGVRALDIISFDRSLEGLALASQAEHADAFGMSGELAAVVRDVLAHGRHDGAFGSWRVIVGELPGTFASLPSAMADVVLWDAFSPRRNPELWTVQAFRALRRVCREGCTVHTFSGATAVRSALLLAGFAVGFGPGVGAKQKLTTIAALAADQLSAPLDGRWLERLSRSTVGLPSDAPADALAQIRAAPQFAR